MVASDERSGGPLTGKQQITSIGNELTLEQQLREQVIQSVLLALQMPPYEVRLNKAEWRRGCVVELSSRLVLGCVSFRKFYCLIKVQTRARLGGVGSCPLASLQAVCSSSYGRPQCFVIAGDTELDFNSQVGTGNGFLTLKSSMRRILSAVWAHTF